MTTTNVTTVTNGQTVSDLLAVSGGNPVRTSRVIDFINSASPVWMDTFGQDTEGKRLRTNAIQNARNERDRLIRNGMPMPVTIHTIGNRFSMVNWNVVTPEEAIQLRSRGFKPVRASGDVKTTVQKTSTQTSVS